VRRRGPLRVALLSDWYLPRRGGIELHLADLAERLAAAGHRVDVLTTTPGGAGDGAGGAASNEAEPNDAAGRGGGGGAVRVLRLAVPRLPGAGVAYTPALGRAIGRALDAGAAGGGAYDVVHAHASVVAPVAWAGVWAARRRGVPCVVTAHSVLRAAARALGAADALTGWARGPVLVTGVSAVVADALRPALPGARVEVLPNATDVGWWRSEGGPAATPVPPRAPGEVRLVTAMRFAAKKRPLALVDVLAAARAAAGPGARVRMVAAGDGPLRAALARAAAARGVGDALALPGWLPRPALRALYHDADAFVLPTVGESFGIAALEARAAGLPVLGRSGTGLAEFVRDGGDGVLAPDDAALAAAAARLAVDGAWRRALRGASAAGPPWAFDWGAVVARHEAAYAAVYESAHGAAPAAAHPATSAAASAAHAVAGRAPG
jgi:glycosyltransferase involved in cell wall biosynthesis